MKVKLADLKQHIGDSVIVEGAVKNIQYLPNEVLSPTYINIGNAGNLLTVVIWAKTRNLFTIKPENAYKNKSIRVSGRLLNDKGNPRIIINNPSQIVLLDSK